MPSAPVMGDGMVSTTCQLEFGDAVGDFFDGELVDFGVADDATFADVAAAGFELRLDEDDGFSECGRGCEDGSEQERGGDEGDVHDEQGECGLAGFGECAGGEEAGIGALNEANAGSLRSFMAIWPKPVSTAVTCAAPRCSRQSVNPPVEAPMSRQDRPATSIFQ